MARPVPDAGGMTDAGITAILGAVAMPPPADFGGDTATLLAPGGGDSRKLPLEGRAVRAEE